MIYYFRYLSIWDDVLKDDNILAAEVPPDCAPVLVSLKGSRSWNSGFLFPSFLEYGLQMEDGPGMSWYDICILDFYIICIYTYNSDIDVI